MGYYQGVVQERRKVRSLASGGCYVDKIAPKSRRTLLKTATAVAGAVAGTSLPALASAAPAAQGAEVIKIVSSLPLTGPSYGQSISVVNAIRMAIEEAGRKSGNYIIEYEALDDATAAAAKWMAEKEAENANKALNDPDTMVYIGTMNSGAAKVSIPILNQANLVMISPANTYPGLTKPGKGEANEPDVYYPSGSRNYTRVVPADDLQGAVGANWAKKLGAKTAYVIDDTELYGKGIADVFVATAEKIGIKLVGRSGIDGKASDYRAVATNVRALKPDAVYFGGITDNNAAKVLKDLRDGGFDGSFIGPDGIFDTTFLKTAGDAAEGAYCTFGGVAVSSYEGSAKEFADNYKAAYHADPEAYAIYGYEAAKVALAAIAAAGVKDRTKIRDAVFATKDFKGILGTWGFDANGDTSVTTMSVSIAARLADGTLSWEKVEILTAG